VIGISISRRCEPVDLIRRADAFGDVAKRVEDRCKRRSGGEAQADGPIARQLAGTGEHEIAGAGESHECRDATAEVQPKPGNFGEAARDERRTRVQTEPQSVADAGSDRDHVFRRTGHLDADQIVARVDA
jgi:hypothetical protein